ncbi:tryptophan synthase subunit alpha [Couchioplanes caeruleus]|uniref:tryptophan synthase subunit alpha n=1 Tax=Couchioplanes caeruleus TaxID=56438 RepID=UPI00201C7769|nr:tryptophan synthase subunit alpha [Couchioplanes caeruleus]UQU61994.1 tryptophan synthase subunit alpha [Couchioplanes caeruleus]
MSTLGATLRAAGRPLLIPYVTGGLTAGWADHLDACQDAGADAIEIGLPFSDPMLDGTTIQQASDRALARGATVGGILADIEAASRRVSVPLIVMTYANLALRLGAPRLAAAGVRGLIVPDLPLEESAPLEAAAAGAGIDLILLAAPSTPDDRLRQICRRSRGFVYAVSVMGTTGERDTLPATAVELVRRVKRLQPDPDGPERLPVLIGFGVSTPEHAAEAGRAGDGVIVASALMRRVLDGATPDDLRVAVAALRTALDLGVSSGTPYAEVSGDRR